MSATGLRAIACAGALATSLLLTGPGVATAVADSDLGADVGTERAQDPDSATDPPETDGPGIAGTGGAPASTVGNGRNDGDDPDTRGPSDKPGTNIFRPSMKFRPLSVPMLRIPSPQEFGAPGGPPPSAFFTTVEVPSVGAILRSLSQPEPEPTPSPSFRTKEDAPVIDATSGGGGGTEQATAGGAPPVLRVPLVAAAPMPRIPPLGAGSAAPAPQPAGQPAVAGANAPALRGSMPPSVTAGPGELVPAGRQAPRAGYERYLQNRTVGQISAIALPGVAGLMLITFSGGVIGYRQANSARFIRTAGAARFLP